jgi:hypothetical protein
MAAPAALPVLRNWIDAAEAGRLAVQRAVTDPGTSLQVLETVFDWCLTTQGGGRNLKLLMLSLSRRQFMRHGWLLPPMDSFIMEGLSRQTEVLVFHGVVSGVELRLHFADRRLTEIELPPRRCVMPDHWSDIDVQAFSLEEWRSVLPYAVFVHGSLSSRWGRVAAAVIPVAARQLALLTTMVATDTTPAMARAALARDAHKPGMHVFVDLVAWANCSMWLSCEKQRCAPAKLWVMFGAQTPAPPATPFLAMLQTRTGVWCEATSSAIVLLADSPTTCMAITWNFTVRKLLAAWVVDPGVVDNVDVECVNGQRQNRWRAGRAAWAMNVCY